MSIYHFYCFYFIFHELLKVLTSSLFHNSVRLLQVYCIFSNLRNQAYISVEKGSNLIILSIMTCYWRSYGMNEVSGTVFGKVQCMAFITFTFARSCRQSNQVFKNSYFLENILPKYHWKGGLISNVPLPFSDIQTMKVILCHISTTKLRKMVWFCLWMSFIMLICYSCFLDINLLSWYLKWI